jgi:hypothetical protein
MSKQGERYFQISIENLYMLQRAVKIGISTIEVGHGDTVRSEVELTKLLDKKVVIPEDVFLSGMWALKMLEELKRVPKQVNKSFKQIASEVIPKVEIDENYLWIKEYLNK